MSIPPPARRWIVVAMAAAMLVIGAGVLLLRAEPNVSVPPDPAFAYLTAKHDAAYYRTRAYRLDQYGRENCVWVRGHMRGDRWIGGYWRLKAGVREKL